MTADIHSAVGEGTPLETRLREELGADRISQDEAERAALGPLHPDAIVSPRSVGEVVLVMELAARAGARIAVVGSGTRVARARPRVRGASGSTRCLALRTRYLSSVLRLDVSAQLVHAQAGLAIAELEAALARQGLTIGPFAARVAGSTLGGLLSAPRAEAYSPATGHLSESCFALAAVAPDGTVVRSRPTPRAAAGPNLGRLHLGSCGAFGVITSAHLRVFRRPEVERASAFRFDDPVAAHAVARQLVTAELRPSGIQVLLGAGAIAARLEAAPSASCALVVAFGGQEAVVARQLELAERFALAHGATPLGPARGIDVDPDAGTDGRSRVKGQRSVFPLRHSELVQVLPKLAEISRGDDAILVDQVSRQGANVWCVGDGNEVFGPGATRRARASTRGGTGPAVSGAPLLASVLDPCGTMVVCAAAGRPEV